MRLPECTATLQWLFLTGILRRETNANKYLKFFNYYTSTGMEALFSAITLMHVTEEDNERRL
jgi:hypothetical protein